MGLSGSYTPFYINSVPQGFDKSGKQSTRFRMSHKPHRVESCSWVLSALHLWMREYVIFGNFTSFLTLNLCNRVISIRSPPNPYLMLYKIGLLAEQENLQGLVYLFTERVTMRSLELLFQYSLKKLKPNPIGRLTFSLTQMRVRRYLECGLY